MININILTPGFKTSNSQAFLFPIFYNEKLLRALGIKFQRFSAVSPDLLNCDVLFVDSKYYRSQWKQDSAKIIEELHRFQENVKSVLFFDTSDGTGFVIPEVFPYVRYYLKNQIFRDRRLYQENI